MRNRHQRTRLRSQVKKLRRAISSGDGKEADALLRPTLSLLDHSSSIGVIHRNAAARTKSRLTRQVAALAP